MNQIKSKDAFYRGYEVSRANGSLMPWMVFLWTALMMSAALLCTPSHAETKEYSFGVVPQQSAKKTASLWAPLLQRVSEQSGIKLRFHTAKSIPAFESKLIAGHYDFAYMNPYHFVVFNKFANYQALAKRKDQPIRGIIVARKDKSIQQIEQLSGQKIAFPSPAAFGASVLPRAYFEDASITVEPKYVSSHDSVYLSVAKGIFLAGGGVKRTFLNIAPEIREQLEIVWTTPAYTPHAIAHHKRVPKIIVDLIEAELLKLSDDPSGLALLNSLKIKNGFERANNEDWDDVRNIPSSVTRSARL